MLREWKMFFCTENLKLSTKPFSELSHASSPFLVGRIWCRTVAPVCQTLAACANTPRHLSLSRRQLIFTLAVVMTNMFSKYFASQIIVFVSSVRANNLQMRREFAGAVLVRFGRLGNDTAPVPKNVFKLSSITRSHTELKTLF